MKVCIVAASELELAQINSNSPHHEKHELAVGGYYFAQKLQSLLNRQAGQTELFVLVGIAGCSDLHSLGSMVVVSNDQFGDMGVIANNKFESLQDMELRKENQTNATKYNTVSEHAIGKTQAKAITVNSILQDENLNKLRLNKYEASIESMEGAYFHYLCEQYQMPYLHIRGLSNYIGERDKTQWKIADAINNYSSFLNQKLAEWS